MIISRSGGFFFACILVLIFLSPTFGQTDITPKTIRINLTVGAPTTALKTKIYDAVFAELSARRDLELVDQGYIYGLEIVAYDIRTSTGVNLGIALSTLTTNIIPCQEILQTKDGKFNAKYQIVSHALTLTDSTRLRSEIQSIVTAFDKHLNPLRGVKVTLLN